MENKFIFIVILSLSFVSCKNIAFLSDKKKHNKQQALAISQLDDDASDNKNGVKYTGEELNQASDYLTALSIYLTEMKHLKKKYSGLLKCDPEFDKISPWSMHVLSLLDAQSIAVKKADLTDCYSSLDKQKNCTEKFQSFCDSKLHQELLKL